MPRSASVRSTASPVLGSTKAPTADAMKAMEPIMLSQAMRQSSARGRHEWNLPTASTANALETRKRMEP